MARNSGIEDLGLRVANERALELMGSQLVLGVLRAPTLHSGIEEFARLVRNESSGMVVWTSRREKSIRFHLKKSFEPSIGGHRHAEWQGLMGMVTMLRLYAGRTWQPEQVSMRSSDSIPALAARLFPKTRFASTQPCAFLEFPRNLMSLGRSEFGAEVRKRLESDSEDSASVVPAMDFAESLQKILRAYLRDGYPSLAMAAEIFGMSKRTMQRRLAEAGLSYSGVISRVRFDIASEMLTQTDASSLDIAFTTGYEDPAHFARAFRRVAGCCPREYRRRGAITDALQDFSAEPSAAA
jgi:AraC-like DNA-binding protein